MFNLTATNSVTTSPITIDGMDEAGVRRFILAAATVYLADADGAVEAFMANLLAAGQPQTLEAGSGGRWVKVVVSMAG